MSTTAATIIATAVLLGWILLALAAAVVIGHYFAGRPEVMLSDDFPEHEDDVLEPRPGWREASEGDTPGQLEPQLVDPPVVPPYVRVDLDNTEARFSPGPGRQRHYASSPDRLCVCGKVHGREPRQPTAEVPYVPPLATAASMEPLLAQPPIAEDVLPVAKPKLHRDCIEAYAERDYAAICKTCTPRMGVKA